jgi:hypothetical protein
VRPAAPAAARSGETTMPTISMASGGGDDPKKSTVLVPTGLSEAEIAKVVEFLKALTSTEAWVAPALP